MACSQHIAVGALAAMMLRRGCTTDHATWLCGELQRAMRLGPGPAHFPPHPLVRIMPTAISICKLAIVQVMRQTAQRRWQEFVSIIKKCGIETCGD